MLSYNTVKIVFSFVFYTVFCDLRAQQINSIRNHTHTLLFDINVTLYCSANNPYGVQFLKNLTEENIHETSYFSFTHRPYQSKNYTGLLDPVVQAYDLKINRFSAVKFAYLYGAYLSCKGKVVLNDLIEYSSINSTFLEQAIVATMKEDRIDKQLNDLKSHPSHAAYVQSNCTMPFLTQQLRDTILKELTYAGNNKPRQNVHNNILQRYFHSTLLTFPEITIGKFLHHKLLGTKYSKDVCGNNIGSPSFKDPMAKVICEKYDITVQAKKDN